MKDDAPPSTGMTPELAYAACSSLPHRQHFGQFFTPPKIAAIMADWVLEIRPKTMLDPALGMGILSRVVHDRDANVAITAYEIDPVILSTYAREGHSSKAVLVRNEDFLTARVEASYDAFLMNPPYLRHHDMDYGFNIFAEFSRDHNLEISKASNSYLLFLIKACSLLSAGGRGAAIMPTEWMNANFGNALKKFLIRDDLLREIVYFSNCTEVFGDALTTAGLLFLQRD